MYQGTRILRRRLSWRCYRSEGLFEQRVRTEKRGEACGGRGEGGGRSAAKLSSRRLEVFQQSHTVIPYGFLYQPSFRKFLPMPTHMGSCTGSIVSYAFPFLPSVSYNISYRTPCKNLCSLVIHPTDSYIGSSVDTYARSYMGSLSEIPMRTYTDSRMASHMGFFIRWLVTFSNNS